MGREEDHTRKKDMVKKEVRRLRLLGTMEKEQEEGVQPWCLVEEENGKKGKRTFNWLDPAGKPAGGVCTPWELTLGLSFVVGQVCYEHRAFESFTSS